MFLGIRAVHHHDTFLMGHSLHVRRQFSGEAVMRRTWQDASIRLIVKNPKIAHPQVSQVVFSIVIYSYRNVILTTAISSADVITAFGQTFLLSVKRPQPIRPDSRFSNPKHVFAFWVVRAAISSTETPLTLATSFRVTWT